MLHRFAYIQMQLNDCVNNNVEMKQQVLLTLLSLASAVMQPEPEFNETAIACMHGKKAIIRATCNKGHFQHSFQTVFVPASVSIGFVYDGKYLVV